MYGFLDLFFIVFFFSCRVMTPGDIRENGGGEEKRRAKVVICIINSQATGGRKKELKKLLSIPTHISPQTMSKHLAE